MFDLIRLQNCNNFHNLLFIHWKRYLEKLHALFHLLNFKNLINNINHNVQFTVEYDEKYLAFLDILVIKRNKLLETQI